MRRVTGDGDDIRLYYSNNNNHNDSKIAIFNYFLFHLPLPNDIVTKTIELHLPDGRAASPFYPPFSPTVSGWLLCESSSNGGCLMQYHHIIAPLIVFISFTSSRHQNDRTSPPRWSRRLSLLPQFSPTVIGWLLCEYLSNGGCLMQYHHIIAP